MKYLECDRCHARMPASLTYTAIRRVPNVPVLQEPIFDMCVQTELCQDCDEAFRDFLAMVTP